MDGPCPWEITNSPGFAGNGAGVDHTGLVSRFSSRKEGGDNSAEVTGNHVLM